MSPAAQVRFEVYHTMLRTIGDGQSRGADEISLLLATGLRDHSMRHINGTVAHARSSLLISSYLENLLLPARGSSEPCSMSEYCKS
jgi:hypothetical protein